MNLKTKFNQARLNLQSSFTKTLSFKTTELNSGIKTEILIDNVILSVGFSEFSYSIKEDYLNSMLDAIENYNQDLLKEDFVPNLG